VLQGLSHCKPSTSEFIQNFLGKNDIKLTYGQIAEGALASLFAPGFISGKRPVTRSTSWNYPVFLSTLQVQCAIVVDWLQTPGRTLMVFGKEHDQPLTQSLGKNSGMNVSVYQLWRREQQVVDICIEPVLPEAVHPFISEIAQTGRCGDTTGDSKNAEHAPPSEYLRHAYKELVQYYADHIFRWTLPSTGIQAIAFTLATPECELTPAAPSRTVWYFQQQAVKKSLLCSLNGFLFGASGDMPLVNELVKLFAICLVLESTAPLSTQPSASTGKNWIDTQLRRRAEEAGIGRERGCLDPQKYALMADFARQKIRTACIYDGGCDPLIIKELLPHFEFFLKNMWQIIYRICKKVQTAIASKLGGVIQNQELCIGLLGIFFPKKYLREETSCFSSK
jgi:hypothetical protein